MLLSDILVTCLYILMIDINITKAYSPLVILFVAIIIIIRTFIKRHQSRQKVHSEAPKTHEIDQTS